MAEQISMKVFVKFIHAFQFWLKWDNNNRHFTWRPSCVSENGNHSGGSQFGESPARKFPASCVTMRGNPLWWYHLATCTRYLAKYIPFSIENSWHHWCHSQRSNSGNCSGIMPHVTFCNMQQSRKKCFLTCPHATTQELQNRFLLCTKLGSFTKNYQHIPILVKIEQ